MTEKPKYWQVAVPSPLRKVFDYLPPKDDKCPVEPGVRLLIPFAGRKLVGVLLDGVDRSEVPAVKLKHVSEVIDQKPIFDADLWSLLRWAADYYHHPLGEVLHTAIPVHLRQGRVLEAPGISKWLLTTKGKTLSAADLKRAPLQLRLHEALNQAQDGATADTLRVLSPQWSGAIRSMVTKGWVEAKTTDCLPPAGTSRIDAVTLNAAQQQAVTAIIAERQGYAPFLLHGITGSGKTEVYLVCIEQALQQNRQVLVLVPEIGLTPQLVQRFRQRLAVTVAVQHSGLSDSERHCAWWLAHSGRARVLIGTRSAVFASLPDLGLIVVDEEHDGSYKQQEGFRYHARDIAVMRAKRRSCPVVLGSATPSLESVYRVRQSDYHYLGLEERTGNATLPAIHLLDMRQLKPHHGLSHPLIEAMQQRLQQGEQSLIFLNRRGFAPVMMCHACGWLAHCARCDAHLTVHQRSRRLWCHHCGHQENIPELCPECKQGEMRPIGEGTERVEQVLAETFPQANIVRIDRDSTRGKGELEAKLESIYSGEADILVGTQMLAKGHDFANVTLVGVINADQGLYSVDFRSSEKMFQQLLQVCGRAGRAEKPGQVLIQTYHPDEPLFTALLSHDYTAFADYVLQERELAQFPPYAHLVLLRAEATEEATAMGFAEAAQRAAQGCLYEGVQVMDPTPSPMPKRGGRYRVQLLVQCKERKPLHLFLRQWLVLLEQSKLGKKVRWSIDIDPMDLY